MRLNSAYENADMWNVPDSVWDSQGRRHILEWQTPKGFRYQCEASDCPAVMYYYPACNNLANGPPHSGHQTS